MDNTTQHGQRYGLESGKFYNLGEYLGYEKHLLGGGHMFQNDSDSCRIIKSNSSELATVYELDADEKEAYLISRQFFMEAKAEHVGAWGAE